TRKKGPKNENCTLTTQFWLLQQISPEFSQKNAVCLQRRTNKDYCGKHSLQTRSAAVAANTQIGTTGKIFYVSQTFIEKPTMMKFKGFFRHGLFRGLEEASFHHKSWLQ
uniref:Uncharacterized protein n=1 Tax=Kryptolebias marmoratus TaxID=37003 RepID=A0A3Q3ASJ2_KRYMA